MTINELARDASYHFWRSAKWVLIVSVALGLLALGVTVGIEEARINPAISRVDVIGPSTIPAGSHITVQIEDNIPQSCIGRTRRYIDMDKPDGWPADKRAPADLLPSDSMPDDRPNNIPIPLGSAIGCGKLVIVRDMSGCGAFSGILAGRPAVFEVDAHKNPVRVCIAPAVIPPPVHP